VPKAEEALEQWIAGARRYASYVASDGNISLFVYPDDRPYLRLETRAKSVVILDAGGHEEFIIATERLLPLPRYAMREGSTLVWTLSCRSVVRTSHTLEFGNGETWTFRTPFFGVRFDGAAGGGAKVLGRIGQQMRHWLLWIEPGRDTCELLSALGFMHRQWYRW